jgi:hypothetical protein
MICVGLVSVPNKYAHGWNDARHAVRYVDARARNKVVSIAFWFGRRQLGVVPRANIEG